jgi:hypothetical protein
MLIVLSMPDLSPAPRRGPTDANALDEVPNAIGGIGSIGQPIPGNRSGSRTPASQLLMKCGVRHLVSENNRQKKNQTSWLTS